MYIYIYIGAGSRRGWRGSITDSMQSVGLGGHFYWKPGRAPICWYINFPCGVDFDCIYSYLYFFCRSCASSNTSHGVTRPVVSLRRQLWSDAYTDSIKENNMYPTKHIKPDQECLLFWTMKPCSCSLRSRTLATWPMSRRRNNKDRVLLWRVGQHHRTRIRWGWAAKKKARGSVLLFHEKKNKV